MDVDTFRPAARSTDRPVAVIGAGPVGLAAAAHLRARGREVVVLEAGEVGAHVRRWSHVRLFSPWSQLVDPGAERLLGDTGWTPPAPAVYPTGAEWVVRYLEPLAAALVGDGVLVRTGTRVTGVTRLDRDLLVDAGREEVPFVLRTEDADGEARLTATAVVDASGTLDLPGPLGGDGLPASGERAAASRVAYAVPDLGDPAVRARYAGRHVVVAGSGSSAFTTLVGLGSLADEAPATRVTWLVRRGSIADVFGGGAADALPARGALGAAAHRVVEGSGVDILTGFRTAGLRPEADGRLRVVASDGREVTGVDEVVAHTGYRPDLSLLSEVRLDLDPALQAPRALAPLVDPNVHSCGSVEPHGAAVLAQPEPGLYLVGMKSYGRAPTFLAMTGFEQVRSVAAAIDGDHEAAARVGLVLPETGVCGGSGLFDAPTEVATPA